MMRVLNRLLLTIAYVTSLPVPTPDTLADESLLEGLAKYLPTVGLLIGVMLALLAAVLDFKQTNNLLSASIVIFSWLWSTGGLHMDGFMDTADGVFSHRSRERMLEIMQDSRVGNFAVLAAISLLALKIFALASMSARHICVVLLIVPAWARACEVYAIGRFAYARAAGKGKIWHDTTDFPRDLAAAAIPVALATAVAVYFNGRTALIASGATIAGGVLTAHWLNNKLNGQTGDTYGAVVEAAETFGLVFAAINI
jgi:cobalamin 5'-phosphate synthase/cobalamin synthase